MEHITNTESIILTRHDSSESDNDMADSYGASSDGDDAPFADVSLSAGDQHPTIPPEHSTSDVAVQTQSSPPDNQEVPETSYSAVVVRCKEEGSRCKNRKVPCYYCEQFVFHMRRHLQRAHSELPEVAEVYARSNVCLLYTSDAADE